MTAKTPALNGFFQSPIIAETHKRLMLEEKHWDVLMEIERVLIEKFGWEIHFDSRDVPYPDSRPRVLPKANETEWNNLHWGLSGTIESDVRSAGDILKARRLEKLGLTLK